MSERDPQFDREISPDAIAIVGMSGRFPGAASVDEFWANQKAGVISISHFSDDELEDSFDASTRADRNFVRARAILENPGLFDAPLFGMHPREAELTDPQHRIFLEIALEAIEHAGIDPRRYRGLIGIFAGASMPTYLMQSVLADRAAVTEFTGHYQLDGMQTLVGSLPDALATRVAHKLDLRGPAMTVQSACSTSLLAVVQACHNLNLFQCDVALAGGVSITFPQKRGYLWQEGGMGSKDGTVRPFDAEASGTVFGSGAGIVVLKRLEDAIADRDFIHAVIRGTGVNNDGGKKIGFTAPSAEGQASAITSALANADVDPSSVGYVELHGTATPLGDPIEFDGLKRAFGTRSATGACVLGSAKANVGHLDAAAGVTGLIKAALCLRECAIPPLANFRSPNPHIDLADSAFRIETELTAWPRSEAPRRAGVSSFGVGGTNVHVVLEEAPAVREATPSTGGVHILPLSARTPAALTAQAETLAQYLRRHPEMPLADVAFTLAKGRAEREERGAIVARTSAEAAEKLDRLAKREGKPTPQESAPIVFMFPGQGSQYPAMGKTLYRSEPVFRSWIDRGAEALEGALGQDIRAILYDASLTDADGKHPIQSTVFAQPALFLTQHALAQLWLTRCIRPDAMIGHSVGELVAATLAGVMSFDDAVTLVAARARLMMSAPRGAMLAVAASEERVAGLLAPELDIAAVNAPEMCVAAGPFEAIAQMEARLGDAGIECKRLQTSHAFHSAMMDPVVADLEAVASGIAYHDPQIPYVSCVTGEWAGGSLATDGRYWARHCRNTVRFSEALATVVGDRRPVLLEVGAGRVLSTFASRSVGRNRYAAAVASLPDFSEADRDLSVFNEATAQLWTLGCKPDLSIVQEPAAKRVPLPTYAFQRKLHWIEPPRPVVTLPPPQSNTPRPNRDATELNVSDAMTAQPAAQDRMPRLCSELAAIFEALSGEPIGAAEWNLDFVELGFDSLLLGQITKKIQRQYGVTIAFRQLLGEFPSIDVLARHLDATLTPDAVEELPAAAMLAVEAVVSAMPSAAAPAVQPAAVAAVGDMAAMLQAQLSAMQTIIAGQLDLLRGHGGPLPQAAVPTAITPPAVSAQPVKPEAASEPAPVVASTEEPRGRFRPFDARATRSGATEAQNHLIADLTRRYAAKFPVSMAQAQKHRPYFADPRSAAGFRAEWKDMVFPVVARTSQGSKIWDVDGNEFIDLVNGYGQTAFGHAPDFVRAAVARQLGDGFAIGPQTPLAGEVAEQFSRMVGLDRVTFCNTGSEAVMAAMRLARCVTGRDTIVVFNNDYHGQFDEVLVKAGGRNAAPKAVPFAPGIPPESVANMVVLPFNSPEALDWIRGNASDIAAVIVEPVQSRHPEILAFDFLHELRAITQAADAALVFDEVVTGFRTHPDGMQAVLGIKADMATYGKIAGGGLPVGILAGSARFMDALDGGGWSFGDDSIPEVAPTFFAGTFVRHPLVMAACKAVLDHLEAAGATLQEKLAQKTAALVARINELFVARGVPSRVETYSSWFIFNVASADKFGALFQFNMRLLGVHVLDGYPCFLTTAHSDSDLEKIYEAVAQTVETLQRAGILVSEGHAPALPIAAHAVPIEVPLTEPQIEILLSAQMGPKASCAYNESMTIEFDGAIDATALQGAVNDFVARHEAMRGTVKVGDELKLVIAPQLTIDIPVIEGADDAGLAAIKQEEAATPFDLYGGPLLRALIVKHDTGRCALILTGHHIVFDGWTANLFVNEVAAFYTQRRTGAHAELDPVEPWSSFATASAGANASIPAYWLDRFATTPVPLALPTDRPRPAIKSFAGATVSATIDPALLGDARKAGAKLGCTLFATLFGALQVTIGRIAEQEDIVLGCPTAGQTVVEDKVLAGHCVNFLPLRAPFTMDKPIGEHLKTVKMTLMSAFEHQQITYGALVRALKLTRDPNRTPLTDVQFNLERLGEDIDFGDAKADLVANGKAAVNFDLFFNMVESAKGLRIDADYNTDLFDQSTVVRWIENFRQVLRALVADAATAIGEVDIIGEAERAWLEARNPQSPRLPDLYSIPERFASAAQQYPDRVALVADGAEMTYRELEAASNQMANALFSRGIAKGDFVGLMSGRSIEAIVMILAIIKTGAAYVPLDPAYPAARQEYVLGNCGANIVLIGPGAEDVIGRFALGERAVTYAALSAEASKCEDSKPAVVIRGDDPIYVMYTSGSTGKPKGVVVPHRGIVRLVWEQAYADLGPDETLMLLTALGFDLCQFEIWGALLFGGRLAIVTQAKPSIDDIAVTIETAGVTTALLASALFNVIVEERLSLLAPLRQLVIGADVVSRTHVRRAQEALPHVRFVNGYGPTENSSLCTCYVFPPEGWGPGSSPIGTPIARSTAYIMDARGRLSPQGSVGELYSGGEGVALGYLGKPELTAQRFVPHPDRPEEILYRTGDFARWRTDGTIEFFGRIDGQLKIGGMRVELDEIEAVISEVEGIGEAAVAVSESASGAKTVHAFVTMKSAPGRVALLDLDTANRHVAERLPRHMHPKTIRVVEALPYNANGKVDRCALLKRLEIEAKPSAPRKAEPLLVDRIALEARIGAIWADVLGLSSVDRDDAIFDLGADSLQILRIGARMVEQGMSLENRRLLANPTIAEVAEMLGKDGAPASSGPLTLAPLSAYRRGASRTMDG